MLISKRLTPLQGRSTFKSKSGKVASTEVLFQQKMNEKITIERPSCENNIFSLGAFHQVACVYQSVIPENIGAILVKGLRMVQCENVLAEQCRSIIVHTYLP